MYPVFVPAGGPELLTPLPTTVADRVPRLHYRPVPVADRSGDGVVCDARALWPEFNAHTASVWVEVWREDGVDVESGPGYSCRTAPGVRGEYRQGYRCFWGG